MICVIGGGNMGASLIRGLVAGHNEVTVVERNPERRATWENAQAITLSDMPVACEGAIIAVKPKDVVSAVASAVNAGAERILSVAAGVTTAQLKDLASSVPVLRAMPNIAASVNRSATALCGAVDVRAEDLAWARAALSNVGTVVEVREDQMDAVTGLSGSGPAYLFLITEAMIDAGVAAGLPRVIAAELVKQTVVGAGALLEAGREPAELRASVTTPAGTTAAGLAVLERHGIRSAVLEAVGAAAKRSADLGIPKP